MSRRGAQRLRFLLLLRLLRDWFERTRGILYRDLEPPETENHLPWNEGHGRVHDSHGCAGSVRISAMLLLLLRRQAASRDVSKGSGGVPLVRAWDTD